MRYFYFAEEGLAKSMHSALSVSDLDEDFVFRESKPDIVSLVVALHLEVHKHVLCLLEELVFCFNSLSLFPLEYFLYLSGF